MKGQDKTPEKQLNEVEIGNLPKIIIQNNEWRWSRISGKNGEDARIVYQKLTRTKEQTETNNTLEGINSRITEAEKWISDLDERMVEITAAEQNTEKNNEDSLRNLWDIKCTNMCIRRTIKRGKTWENIWRDNSG